MAALKRGDIDVLVHGVNCSHGFGSGVAGQIAKQYPEVKKAFDRAQFKLGQIQVVQINENQLIINCATQQEYGRYPAGQPEGMYCSYSAIEECMKKVKEFFGKDFRIGMPHIGAGLAGGEWKYISGGILKSVFNGNEKVYAYKHPSNLAATELDTIKKVQGYYQATGFYSYSEKIGETEDQWTRAKKDLRHRHIYFSDTHVLICGIDISRESTKGELLSLFNEVK